MQPTWPSQGGPTPPGPPPRQAPSGPPAPRHQPPPPNPPNPPYWQPASSPELSGAAAAVSVVWALLPLLSFGLASPVAFGYAAYRRWSGWLLAVTAMYAVVAGALLALSAAYPGAAQTPALINRVVGGGLLVVMLGGTVHAFAIRRRVFAPLGDGRGDDQPRLGSSSLDR